MEIDARTAPVRGSDCDALTSRIRDLTRAIASSELSSAETHLVAADFMDLVTFGVARLRIGRSPRSFVEDVDVAPLEGPVGQEKPRRS